ncbi:MAG: hypothetical protein WCL14_14865 [Bacteroidota bacterium]
MPLLPPLKSFKRTRYLFPIAGLFIVMCHSILSLLYINHSLIAKFGKRITAITDKDGEMMTEYENFISASLLFYPIIFLVLVIAYFLVPKAKKEMKTGILLALLTIFLLFGYLGFFANSVITYILPMLLLLGIFAAHKGGHEEPKRVFILLFLILIFAFAASKLSEFILT